MKRIFCVLLAVILLFGIVSLSGCGKNDGSKNNDNKIYTMRFRTDLNTGYDWTCTESKEGIVSVTMNFVPVKDGSMKGTTHITVKPLKKGTVTLSFKRSLSEDVEPDAIINYKFKVTSDLIFSSVTSSDIYFENTDDPPFEDYDDETN